MAAETKHWIVVGRVPFDDEDTVAYIATTGGGNPETKFIHDVLYKNREDELEERRTDDGEPAALFNTVVEIPGPPLSMQRYV